MKNIVNSTTSVPDVLASWERVVLLSGLVLLILLSLVGNILVIFVFIMHKPIRKLINCFIVSLAVSDMMVGILSIPSWIIHICFPFENEMVS